jgi:hypothetical protein
MEQFLFGALSVSIVFFIAMVLLLRRKWRKERETLGQMIRGDIPWTENGKDETWSDGEWKGPGGRPDGCPGL